MKSVQEEMTETLEKIFEARSYNGAFRNEYLGDNVVKQAIISKLSKSFVFEGLGPDRVLHFRKIHNGRLSKPFTIDEIMSHYVENPAVLDMNKWKTNRENAKRAIKAKVLETFDTKEEKMTEQQRVALKNSVEEAHLQGLKVFTNKTLPRYNEDQILADFKKEDPGIPRPKFGDFRYNSYVANLPKQKLEELNSLHDWNPYLGDPDLKSIREYEPKREHWAIDAK